MGVIVREVVVLEVFVMDVLVKVVSVKVKLVVLLTWKIRGDVKNPTMVKI